MGRVHGTTASSCIQAKMFPIFSVVLLASCLYKVDCQRPPYPPAPPPPPPPQHPTPSPVQDYNPDIGQTNVGGYGVNKDPYCHKVEKVIFENKCFTGKDRVCDTTYDIDTTTKDDYQCCNVENDVTCTNTVEFNCKREKTTKNDGYGQKEVVCTRTPKQDCYNIPRKIQVEVCKTDVHRYCEKFSNIFPFPVEKQNCHFEPKKICELEMKTRPKKAKKYSYTKDCKEQPREICDQCEKKSIQPLCDMEERLTCIYKPVEQCKDEDKQYCYKVEEVVVEEVCDMKFDTAYL